MLRINRQSLSYKTTILYIVLAVIIISVFNFIIWENQSDLLIENQKRIIESRSSNLRNLIQTRLKGYHSVDYQDLYEQVSLNAMSENIERTMVFSEVGKVLFNWNFEAEKLDLDRELVLVNRGIARYELENKHFLHSADLEEKSLSIYIPIFLDYSSEWVVFKFSLPLIELSQRKNEVIRICLLVAAFVCILQIFMALFLNRLIINPINRLVKMTMRVAEGDLSQKLTLQQNDELGTLAGAYNQMVINLDNMQKEAKGANPLSGLPGNISIMNAIDKRLEAKEKLAVVYGDIDNFKAYNDKYGLTKGDDAILHTKDAFLYGVKASEAKNTFIGHEGGDDFVIVCPFQYWEPICQHLIEYFDGGVKQFYTESDSNQGFIDSVDRQGNPVRFPLMSISLAVVSNHYRKVEDHRILIAWAAEMKKVVKKKPGSVYAIDKRTY